jgi:hypothetical protein
MLALARARKWPIADQPLLQRCADATSQICRSLGPLPCIKVGHKSSLARIPYAHPSLRQYHLPALVVWLGPFYARRRQWRIAATSTFAGKSSVLATVPPSDSVQLSEEWIGSPMLRHVFDEQLPDWWNAGYDDDYPGFSATTR